MEEKEIKSLEPKTPEVKKRTRKKAPPKIETKQNNESIENLIQSLFLVANIRIDDEIKFQQDEIDLIKKPLSNIIAKYTVNNENTDIAALISGIIIITIPRIIYIKNKKPTIEIENEKKEQTENKEENINIENVLYPNK